MLLCIDIGNTNIKLGLFDGEKLIHHWRISTDRSNLADEYAVLILNLFEAVNIRVEEISGVAFSSVVPILTQEFKEFSKRYLRHDPVVLGPEVFTGMKINTDYPAEVGSDLIMNALAARELYGTPLIIIGFGTATTFSAVSENGIFEGVAIAPGILTSADSLFKSASTLPQVALSHPQTAIGKNTITSLQSGIIFGFAALVEGIVNRMKAELHGDPKVVATGGLAAIIAPETPVIDCIEPNLALIGLRLMYEMNKS